MKNTVSKILCAALAVPMAVACYSLEDEQYAELSPITFNDVSSTIDVMTGEELVYDRLEVTSELPVTYEWAYGPKKTTSATSEYDMQSMEVISDKPDIQYTFTRIGQYILRLKVDNGESIEFKYFTLNVNSGVDEGLLILNNDDAGNGALTFIKKRTEDEITSEAQEIFDDIYSTINPNAIALQNVTDMFMSSYEMKGITYSQFLISTNDDQGRIFKLDPKTLELYLINSMKPEFGTYCENISGLVSSAVAYYGYLRGGDKSVYRYDMQGDFIGKMNFTKDYGEAERMKTLVFSTNATGKINRVGVNYNADNIFRLLNAKEYSWALDGYTIVNLASARMQSKTYILFRSKADPTHYEVRSVGSEFKSASIYNDNIAFDIENLKMDENSIMVNSKNSQDVYYTFDNAVYRWGLTTAPASSPVIRLPEGEEICDMTTNYTYNPDDTESETLLYIATYNPSRASEKKGSVYVYDIATQTLQKSYEGICDRPVRLMYKYRIS